MARVTDDERRRVAAALRRASGPSMAVLANVLCVGSDCAFHRLADLIDPGDMSHGCRDTVACDREALLALADGLEYRADELIRAAQHARFSGLGPTTERAKHDAYELRIIARRIREACGEAGFSYRAAVGGEVDRAGGEVLPLDDREAAGRHRSHDARHNQAR